MLVVAVVGLCRHAVEIGDAFSCKRSNGNELWSLLVVRNHVAKCGITFCWDSTAAVGQQLVDREGVSYVKLTELFKKVTWSSPMVLHMLGFLMCFVGMYVLTSLFLSVDDAENLSLLTSDTNGVAWADVQSTVEIILVMQLPAEQTRRLSWRLGLSSALMVAHCYSGEIQDNFLVRWSWWALAMVPFCSVVRPDASDLTAQRVYDNSAYVKTVFANFPFVDCDFVEVVVPSSTSSVELFDVTVRFFDTDTSDANLAEQLVCALATCSVEEESVTLYRTGRIR